MSYALILLGAVVLAWISGFTSHWGISHWDDE